MYNIEGILGTCEYESRGTRQSCPPSTKVHFVANIIFMCIFNNISNQNLSISTVFYYFVSLMNHQSPPTFPPSLPPSPILLYSESIFFRRSVEYLMNCLLVAMNMMSIQKSMIAECLIQVHILLRYIT